ncbi:putative uncharacterized protein [Bacteroides sp. CAG:661]|uniref:RagB/SusD family nutrient uptake outer membrane protein n=1 Tax=uncultured Mediterranea sp. TaxID=1926662 RepID=UPI0003396CF3|nr:RagB/SusD family nutrient uptake outer membrane protein [uncultured Mediterranea sp.]CCZ47647.1 putative uncharacterized protein [Bacteroides sp. CAG:661]
MKTKIILSCLVATTLVSTSCSDFLTEDPKGQLTPSNFFVSQDALDASVYSLYAKVNGTQTYTNMMYPQWQGDDMTANSGSNKQAVAELDGFSANNNNKGVQDAWSKHYTVIKAANLILNNAGDTPVSETEVNIALGQAHFWRAYAYYYMVRIFGPLPLVKTADELSNDIQLSSVEDVYKLIVDDLKAAEGMLPTSYSTAPRNHDGVDAYVTKQAVQATLSAVYMSMAGYPLNKGAEYYALAAAKAKEVIDKEAQYGFYLDSEWSHVYSMGHNYNKETVLGIDYSPVVDWATDSQLSSCNRFESLGDAGWGDSWGEIAFWKRFPEGPRKNAVYAPKITFQDANYRITKAVDWWELDNDGKPVVSEYHPMFTIFTTNCDAGGAELAQPYDYTQPNYTGMCNGHRHRVIRYSEVLLWYAESAARAGESDLNLAKQCLKRVRQRAVTDYESVALSDGSVVKIDDMNASQLAEACYMEHGWEVAGYWVAMVTRRSDEFRMNELKKNFDYRVANPEIEVAPGFKAKESVTVVKSTWAGDNSIYIPYPDTEVEKNPNLNRDLVK